MTVAENIEYGLRVRRVPRPRAPPAGRPRAGDGPADRARRAPAGQLSGGQRQRVALARAIVNEPQVLLLDEPLGALDLKLRQEMQLELQHVQRAVGITFIYVTHDQDEALSMSDRIAVVHQGRIEQVGSPIEVYERPRTGFVAGFIGISNLIVRDGRQITVRPEKISLLAGDEPAPPGAQVESRPDTRRRLRGRADPLHRRSRRRRRIGRRPAECCGADVVACQRNASPHRLARRPGVHDLTGARRRLRARGKGRPPMMSRTWGFRGPGPR